MSPRHGRSPSVWGSLVVAAWCWFLLATGRSEAPSLVLLSSCMLAAASLVLIFVHCRRITLGVVATGFYLAFHFGLALPVALGLHIALLTPTDATWVNPTTLAWPATVASAFAAGFVVAYVIGDLTREAIKTTDELGDDGDDDVERRRVDGAAEAGLLLLVAGVGLWTSVFINSGTGIVGSYATWLQATQGSATPYAYLLISLAMGVLGASRSPGVRTFGGLVFLVWSVPAFLLGLRGEVLIPALAFLITRVRSGARTYRPWSIAALVVGGLAAGSVVRVLRVGGENPLSAFNPFNGLAELGYSIRPMVMVLNTQASYGEHYVGIGTYTAPFERLVSGRILGHPVESVSTDQNVFGTFIASHFGPIGGSISAEAERAGGLSGVLLLSIALGVVCVWLDNLRQGISSNAFVGMATSVLLLWIRNDVTPLALSLVAIVVIWLFIRARSTVLAGPRARGSTSRAPSVVGRR